MRCELPSSVLVLDYRFQLIYSAGEEFVDLHTENNPVAKQNHGHAAMYLCKIAFNCAYTRITRKIVGNANLCRKTFLSAWLSLQAHLVF